MEVEFMGNVRDEIFYCKNCLNESKSKLSTSGFYSSISAKAKDNLDIYIGIRWKVEIRKRVNPPEAGMPKSYARYRTSMLNIAFRLPKEYRKWLLPEVS